MELSTVSSIKGKAACTLRIDRNLLWHGTVSLRQDGSCNSTKGRIE